MSLSRHAIIFGLGYLNGPRCKLSFGGEGAKMGITPRARAALDELIAAGYAETAPPADQIPGREHYRGTTAEPRLGQLAGCGHFGLDVERWTSFEKLEGGT